MPLPPLTLPRTAPAPPPARAQGVVSSGAAGEAASAPAQAANAKPPGDDYFLEPLMRSFLLGVGAGAVVETSHVLFKAFSLGVEAGPQMMELLPASTAEFAPLFLWDHVAAL